MTKKIAYKVVSKRSRLGSNLTIFLSINDFDQKLFEKWKENNKRLWSSIKKYFPVYKKGCKIKAPEKSLGILCFENKQNARWFKESFSSSLEYSRIIKVRGIGKKRKISKVRSMGGKSLFDDHVHIDLSKIKNGEFTSPNFGGIVSYPSVEVLE